MYICLFICIPLFFVRYVLHSIKRIHYFWNRFLSTFPLCLFFILCILLSPLTSRKIKLPDIFCASSNQYLRSTQQLFFWSLLYQLHDSPHTLMEKGQVGLNHSCQFCISEVQYIFQMIQGLARDQWSYELPNFPRSLLGFFCAVLSQYPPSTYIKT